MPELDSAIVEQDYASLPGLCNIETDEPAEAEPPAESAAYELTALRRCSAVQHHAT